ncbi:MULTISPECIES: EamA family transporter [unclassified Facklamia]|uniref:DMT family transporter n=1 Tax=Aerococcaceae TaxID=186827 RepID=UPI0013B6E6B1|nr:MULTISPECIES: EamA family transporter [unclassified Facklamia]NEW64830.1 EamA family transporter [Facklamia sp. 252]NEW68152.1 EamA family transporter [Facklamia sp. 253]QQD64983.1 EamA family transporter [Aerococcaceae bacterium zg-252]
MNDKLKLIFAMTVVGSIGVFVHYIQLPSAFIALCRAVIGSIFIFAWIKVTGRSFDWKSIKKNGLGLLISGFAMGFNWIFLFEAYQYTTIAIATLCYYMAPIIIILLSPLFFKERLTKRQIGLTLFAVIGAVLISGVLTGHQETQLQGVLYGLIAASLYASIMIVNKLIKGLDVMVKTFWQLLIAAIVMSVYVANTIPMGEWLISPTQWVLLFIIGSLHTGFVYVLLFSAFDRLPSQTASLLTYLDPITAILFSLLFLQQGMTVMQLIGTMMILCATILNEWQPKRNA